MSLVISTLACLSLAFLVVVASTALRERSRRREMWLHEDTFCACGHDYYDHSHWEVGKPCASLMCSCPQWDPEGEN